MISRLNSLSVLSNAISRCTSGACCCLIVCVLLSCYAHQVALIDREFAQLGCFQTDYELFFTLGVISGCPDRSEEQSSP